MRYAETDGQRKTIKNTVDESKITVVDHFKKPARVEQAFLKEQ